MDSKKNVISSPRTRALKLAAQLFFGYLAIVVLSESFLGFLQPEFNNTLTITFADKNGVFIDRVLVRLDSNEQLYVSANHWPRAWYHGVVENPEVQVQLNGQVKSTYFAVPVTDKEEHDRVNREHSHGMAFRFLTGFAPRVFLRLVPKQVEA